MPKCSECDIVYDSRRSLMNHYYDDHGGELWPDEEHLGAPESEQRDFEGEEPDDIEHDPKYLGDTEKPDSEKTRLEDYK